MTLQTSEPAAVPSNPDTKQPVPNEAWANEAPLRLVAWALDSVGRTAKTSEIREKLEGRLVHDPKWKDWWKRVRPALIESHQFAVRKKNTITLDAKVADVPAQPWDSLPVPVNSPSRGPKKKAATAADWQKWFEASVSEPPPGPRPTKAAFSVLGRRSSKNIGLALDRTVWGAREYLESGSAKPQPAAAWLELVSRAFTRFRDLNGPDAALALALDVGELLTSLALVTGYNEDSVELLLSAGALPGEPHPWQRQFVAGMWRWLQQSSGNASQLLDGSLGHDKRSGRAAMARQLVAAALNLTDPTRLHSELDRILDRLFMDERLQLIHDLMVRSAAGEAPKEATLAYVVHSRHLSALTDSAQRLDLLVMASILLSDGSAATTEQASLEIGNALVDSSPERNGPVWSGLFSESRQRLADIQAQYAQELERQRRSYERQLEDVQQEKERLTRRVEGLRAQIAEGRELSKMDILEDILMVTAETLQTLHQQKENPETLLRNVKAKLALALGAGGAKEFGTVGEIVQYDPRVHHADGPTNVDAPVRISVPGTIMQGKLTSSRVLLQAQVTKSSESD